MTVPATSRTAREQLAALALRWAALRREYLDARRERGFWHCTEQAPGEEPPGPLGVPPCRLLVEGVPTVPESEWCAACVASAHANQRCQELAPRVRDLSRRLMVAGLRLAERETERTTLSRGFHAEHPSNGGGVG